MTARTSDQPGSWVRTLSPRSLIWLFHVALPIVGLWLLVTRPQLDLIWEDHVAHFWLVLITAGINVGLAFLVGQAAYNRQDARLYLVSLAFLCAAGFFSLHALATPAVILGGPNAGFVVATPVGIVLAGLFALASSFEYTPAQSARILRFRPLLTGGLIAVIAAWQLLALAGATLLNEPLPADEAQGSLRGLALTGVLTYAAAAIGYFRLYRRRPSVVLLGVITAFVLLAESLIALAEARSWHASWWEWHVLMTLAFGFVAYSANVEYRREGRVTSLFRALSLEETVRQLREEYAAALQRLVGTLEEARESGRTTPTPVLASQLSGPFGLTEGQADVLAEAAEAVAAERREVRRLGLFRRYLSPEVASALLEDPSQAALGGSTIEISVLFADLRGFTPFTERSEPAEVVALLNTYFGAVVPIILGVGGTIVQFIGDAIMAIFNAPVRQPDHAVRAARAALAFQARTRELAAAHPDWPLFRVGIATGPAVVGNVGSDEVRSYSAIGDTVNLAARLQTSAQVGQVVVSPATAAALGSRATLLPIGALSLKGKSQPVEAYELVAIESVAADILPPEQADAPREAAAESGSPPSGARLE
jgi:adenylate cyclase